MTGLYKAKNKKTGEWVEGFYVKYHPCASKSEWVHGIVPTYASALYIIEIDPETLCQYTGLKKYAEKDIVKRTDLHVVGEPTVGVIKYDVENTAFIIRWIGEKEIVSPMYPWKDKIEVVGNIFDNSDLMEGTVE